MSAVLAQTVTVEAEADVFRHPPPLARTGFHHQVSATGGARRQTGEQVLRRPVGWPAGHAPVGKAERLPSGIGATGLDARPQIVGHNPQIFIDRVPNVLLLGTGPLVHPSVLVALARFIPHHHTAIEFATENCPDRGGCPWRSILKVDEE
jgi:hypothetical protein